MRNFAEEMREIIDKYTVETPYEPAKVADLIVKHLLEHDSELLHGYLCAQATHIVRNAINRRDASQRVRARRASVTNRMAEITQAVTSGEVTTMAEVKQRWLNCAYTLADGKRHLLRDLDAGDLLYVAAEYDQRARESKMEAAFMRALARMVGPRTVGETFTEERLAEVRRLLTPFL